MRLFMRPIIGLKKPIFDGDPWFGMDLSTQRKAPNAVPGSVAANNHKAPADWFTKKLLSASETHALLEKMVADLHSFNPHLQIIFTISPVRHLREGMIGNNRSKAVLIQAVHQFGWKPHFHCIIFLPTNW